MLFESAATKTPRCRTQHLAFDNGGSLAMIERRMQMMYDVRCILVTVILVSSWLEPRHSHRWEKRTREGRISRAEKGLSKPRFRRNKIIIATPRVTRGKREGRGGGGEEGLKPPLTLLLFTIVNTERSIESRGNSRMRASVTLSSGRLRPTQLEWRTAHATCGELKGKSRKI